MTHSLCPGDYCGVANSTVTDVDKCSSCQWGYRPSAVSVCQLCVEPMALYDWMYLGFMFILSFVLHCIVISTNTNRKSMRMILMYISALMECATAAICSLLLMAPTGTLELYSCGVISLQDWYPVFYNPTTFHCTQEMVYPLYTIVMIYYSLQIPAMLLFRPIFFTRLFAQRGLDTSTPIYGALYFLPLLVLVQAVAGGILYYCYPHVALSVSTISLTVHLSHFQDQTIVALFQKSLFKIGSLSIVLLHFFLHAYGIFSIVDVSNNPGLASGLLILVPVPFLVYILTSWFTNPEVLDRLNAQ